MSMGWFKKAAIFNALTVLLGGAEIAGADTITQSKSFSNLSCSVTPCLTLSFNKFDPSFGKLTDVEIDLTSNIFATTGFSFSASAGSSLSGLLTGSPLLGTGNGSTAVVY